MESGYINGELSMAAGNEMKLQEDQNANDVILCPRKLLDMLLVVCPNVDYCEEVLPRCDLESHLANRCKGSMTKCTRASSGCTFQGPRSALQNHLWQCPFREEMNGMKMLPRTPILEGDVTTIDIRKGCYEFGFSLVGGCDTPLVCVVIQEIFPDGIAAKDGRLQAGDQLLEVNGLDLTLATHHEARQALKQPFPVCRLTVYREKTDDSIQEEKEEVFKIALPKVPGKQLGIKLVGRRNGTPGLHILEMIPGSLAYVDSRLHKDDKILEINCQDMSYATQEQAAKVIAASVDKVQFVISRKNAPSTPTSSCSSSQSPSREFLSTCSHLTPSATICLLPPVCRERFITLHKEARESLGISVAGGLDSSMGDLPIYVTNVQDGGCLGRCKHIKKGDILLSISGQSLLDLTHAEAVALLKRMAEAKMLTLKFLEGTETSEGPCNFNPTWKFWLSMPETCQFVKTIQLQRKAQQTLGFSIVGGNDGSHSCTSVYVKSIVPKTPAGRDGRLRSGDLLLSVNDHNLDNVTHSQAVSLLKSANGEVTIRVVSWPGTIV